MQKRHRREWQIPDLVDYEYFLARDAGAEEMELIRRDRRFYRNRLSERASLSRPALLRHWLDLRREESRAREEAPLPGGAAGSASRLLSPLLFILGTLAGSGLAWGVLSYSGDRPINLFAAMAWLVGIPFLTAIFSAVLLLKLVRRGHFSGLFGGWLVGALWTRIGRSLHAVCGESDRSRRAMAQSWGILRARSGLYSEVVGWHAFTLMQIGALGFSLAALLTVLATGWISDLAFSWQTTAWFSAEGVHRFVAFLARPWAGMAEPPFSHPTLEQVEGSRVFLKEGLRHLSSVDLQSWWYFLLWSILAYSALPRLLLLGAAFAGRRRAWERLSFRDARSEALVRRMQQPQLNIGKDSEQGEGGARLPEEAVPDEIGQGIDSLRALVPEELLDRPAAEAEIAREFGASIEAVAGVKVDEEEDARTLQSLAESDGEAVLLVLEGWQPCITATLEYLRALRRLLGRDRLLIVGLIGRGFPDGWSSATGDDFEIWRGRLAELGDPLLLVHNWGRTGHE